MKTTYAFLLFLILTTQSLAADKVETGLCKDGEVTVFNCQLKKKTASVCASQSVDVKDRYFQYRFGSQSKVELAIPEKAARDVKAGNLMYAGGGGMFLVFKNNDTNYVVFSQITRNGEDSGVVVEKAQAKVASLKCNPTTELHMSLEEVKKYGIPTIDDPGVEF